MNKKASVPVTILVIGVFALCSLAMFTFFVSDFKIGNSFVGLGVMQEINSEVEAYYFYKNVGVDNEDLKLLFDVVEIDGRNYIKKELTYESFSFLGKNEEVVLFSVLSPIK